MTEYRQLPHGTEKINPIGIGLGAIQDTPEKEIEEFITKAIDKSINFFDTAAAMSYVFAPFGRAIKGKRDKIFLQVHFGAVYNEKGEYGWSRDLNEIKSTFEKELKLFGTDYVDFGFLHCVDQEKDIEDLQNNGIIDFVKELKAKNIVRHIAFSSHTPATANKILDMGIADLMMFSINVAYDYEKGDEYGIGSNKERTELFARCQKDGVGISVMKPFHGGKLLDAKQSPFKTALTSYQCLQYILDRPGVLCVVPGISSMEQLDELLGFFEADEKQKDYSVIGTFTKDIVTGSCVYCTHCHPCPAGINIALVNKYYDLAKLGDKLAVNHYKKLSVNASACINCGHCSNRCPFKVNQSARMHEISEYFSKI